jgi:glycosyltransferase involved in cell wall biosynthesis
MKIVFITTALTTGGAEIMLLKLLQHIDRGRFDPQVISLRTKGDVGSRIEALGIPVLALNMKQGVPNPLIFLKLVKHLQLNKPELVQTWMYHADLLGGLAARLAGCRHVVWGLRNSNLDRKLTKRSTLMVVKACAVFSSWLPEKILSCSKRAAEAHTKAGYRAEKIQIIPNGFDLGRFKPDNTAKAEVRSELGLTPDTPLVGLMARFDPQKNHAGFVEAAAIIRSLIPSVHFVLAGAGIDGGNVTLLETVSANNLGECTHLLGRRDDMPRLMAALDILASSSSFGEAFPNVLGEAMACNVPCVVTNVGDSADIVGDSGRVVHAGDMLSLAKYIVELLRLSPEVKSALGRQARARVETRYEIGHVARLYESFYERLVGLKLKGNA